MKLGYLQVDIDGWDGLGLVYSGTDSTSHLTIGLRQWLRGPRGSNIVRLLYDYHQIAVF